MLILLLLHLVASVVSMDIILLVLHMGLKTQLYELNLRLLTMSLDSCVLNPDIASSRR